MKRIACIAVALCAVLFACYEAPLGKPENSKVDHRLDGLWITQDGAEIQAWLVVPFDDHVDCVVAAKFSIVDGKPVIGRSDTMRAWITPLAGASFITLEPIAQMLPEYKDEKIWFNARLTFRADGTVDAETLEYEYKGLRSEKDPVALARAVEANIADPALFSDPMNFHRPDPANPIEAKIRAALMGKN